MLSSEYQQMDEDIFAYSINQYQQQQLSPPSPSSLLQELQMEDQQQQQQYQNRLFSYTNVNAIDITETTESTSEIEIKRNSSQPQEKFRQYSSTYATDNADTTEPAHKKIKLSQQKRDRECRKREYKYNDGNDFVKGSIPTIEQTNDYEEFIKDTEFCVCCKKEVSVIDILLYKNETHCMDCLKQLAKQGQIEMKYLKTDYFESKNYDKEQAESKLWNCKRLKHSRPAYHFLELIKEITKQLNMQ